MAIKESLTKTPIVQEYKNLDDRQLSYALLSTYEQIVLPLALAATSQNVATSGWHDTKGKQSYGIMDQCEKEIDAMLLAARLRAEQKGVKIPPRTNAKGLTCELDETNRVRDWEARLMQLGPLFSDTAEKADWAKHAAWRDNKNYVVGPLQEKPYQETKYFPVYDDEREAMRVPQKPEQRIIDDVKKTVLSQKEMSARITQLNKITVR